MEKKAKQWKIDRAFNMSDENAERTKSLLQCVNLIETENYSEDAALQKAVELGVAKGKDRYAQSTATGLKSYGLLYSTYRLTDIAKLYIEGSVSFNNLILLQLMKKEYKYDSDSNVVRPFFVLFNTLIKLLEIDEDNCWIDAYDYQEYLTEIKSNDEIDIAVNNILSSRMTDNRVVQYSVYDFDIWTNALKTTGMLVEHPYEAHDALSKRYTINKSHLAFLKEIVSKESLLETLNEYNSSGNRENTLKQVGSVDNGFFSMLPSLDLNPTFSLRHFEKVEKTILELYLFEGYTNREIDSIVFGDEYDTRGFISNDIIKSFGLDKNHRGIWKPYKNFKDLLKLHKDYQKEQKLYDCVFGDEVEEFNNMDIFSHNLYGVHITKSNNALSLDNPYICIGWSGVGNLSNMSLDQYKTSLSTVYPGKKQRSITIDAGQLNRFVNIANIGDYVIFSEGKLFHIGVIDSEYYYDINQTDDKDDDYVNFRKVRWLKTNIDKSIVSKSMVNSMQARMSFFSMNDYKSVVFDLLNDVYTKDENDEGEFEMNEFIELSYVTGILKEQKRNRIIFGAPGTGKSFTLNKEKTELISNGGSYERVTFHPDYTYANFVGTYKPVPVESGISYKYVPGPFMRVYVEALKDARDNKENAKPHVLVIEEINRANVAAVFGDVFQLLDRSNNISEYPIQPSEDIKAFLASEKGLNAGSADDYDEIKIPDNMFIWATMNSADQGVYPMDTAFKRRWDFSYLGINDGEKDLKDKEFALASGDIKWNDLRKAINARLSNLNINEDKLLGPFFINEKSLTDTKTFSETFKNKVIMYLYEDAAKAKRKDLFVATGATYSELCELFDSEGIKIFKGLEQ